MSVWAIQSASIQASAGGALHRTPTPGPWHVLHHPAGLGSIVLAIALGFAALAIVEGLWLAWHFLRVGAANRGEG